MTALAELIWNALDAEATTVRVAFDENELGGLDSIRIEDDGHGLHHDDAFIVFQNLGGSWKRRGNGTQTCGRLLHGKYGKGRFRAFSLGNQVSWRTVYEEAGDRYGYIISGAAASLGEFQVTDARGAIDQPSGMIVEIQDPPDAAWALRGVKALEEVTNIFALYLRQYPGVRIMYDGVPIDPANAERSCADYQLDEMITADGERVNATLTVVEWNLPRKRGLYFCDQDGFMRHKALLRLNYRGFSYTAYLKSSHVPALEAQGLLQTGELAPDVRMLLDAARVKLREHFAAREVEQTQDTLQEWKETGLYPYMGEAKDEAEANERRVFDACATHLNQLVPEFACSRPRHKRVTLRLIQELVRANPPQMARILDELVESPEGKHEEMLELILA
jgi:Histidine kinase-, DNA gyrase B-, and HSP90-like ATPase